MEKSRFASEDAKERELISLMLNPRSSLKCFSFLKQSHWKKTPHLSQWNPSTLSLHAHRPVSTLHSPVLPAALQEQGLGEAGERLVQ